MKIISVTFKNIYPRQETTMPIDQAWDYYLTHQTESVESAMIEIDGEQFKTFAKQWSSWDFDNQVWHLQRIGFGAYGDSAIKNPNADKWQFETIYDKHPNCPHWVTGFHSLAA